MNLAVGRATRIRLAGSHTRLPSQQEIRNGGTEKASCATLPNVMERPRGFASTIPKAWLGCYGGSRQQLADCCLQIKQA